MFFVALMGILLCYKYTRKDIIQHPVGHCNHSKEIIVNDTRQKTKYYLIIYFIRQHIERISDTASTIAEYSGYKNRVLPIFVNYVIYKRKNLRFKPLSNHLSDQLSRLFLLLFCHSFPQSAQNIYLCKLRNIEKKWGNRL